MKINRKIDKVFSNFNNKIVRLINFCKIGKRFVKVKVSTIRLKNRSKI